MSRKVLMIGLDAMECSLFERWTADGSLPNLNALRDAGAYGRLASPAELFVGSTWPAFFTGRPPDQTGFYHSIQWRPDRMRHGRPLSADLVLEPFWRELSYEGPRVLALDVPMLQEPRPLNGIEINGWANHDLLADPGCHPPELFDELGREFGRPPVHLENYRLETVDGLLAIRDREIAKLETVSNLWSTLLRREAWDLGVVVLQASHNAGHKLWNERNVSGDVPADRRDEFDRMLLEVYRACDRAVGELVEAAGPGVTVIVFALHGMGTNTCRDELLRPLLDRIMAAPGSGDGGPLRDRLLRRVREWVPQELRYNIKLKLMPPRLRDAVTTFWRTGARDWNKTTVFNIQSDVRGYVRVNLAGRETAGVVEPGEAYEEVLDHLEEGLRSFVEPLSGRPVVAHITRPGQRYANSPGVNHLPDMVIEWDDDEEAALRGISSPRYGDIAWPTPGRHPTGRSGNHRSNGWVLASGPGIDATADLSGAQVIDLAPSVHALMQVPVAGTTDFHGRPLAFVAQRATTELT